MKSSLFQTNQQKKTHYSHLLFEYVEKVSEEIVCLIIQEFFTDFLGSTQQFLIDFPTHIMYSSNLFSDRGDCEIMKICF